MIKRYEDWPLKERFDAFLTDAEDTINDALSALEDSLTGVNNGSECPADTKIALDTSIDYLTTATDTIKTNGQGFRDEIDTLENQEEAIREEAMEYYMNQD